MIWPLLIEVEVDVMADPPPEDPTFVIAFHRPGVAAGGYVHADRLQIPATRRFAIRTHMDTLLLGSGGWLITVGLAESDFYRASFHPYFTVNEKWHHVIARGFELQVDATTLLSPRRRGDRARRRVTEGLADILAADNNGDGRLLETGHAMLREHGGTEQAELLTVRNPAAILADGLVEDVPPIALRVSASAAMARMTKSQIKSIASPVVQPCSWK